MNDQIEVESAPPINRTQAGNIEHLRIDAEEAAMLVTQLEGKLRDAQRLLGELDDQIRAAKEERDRAVSAYHAVVPKKLPPVPDVHELMQAAINQRPLGDDRESRRMALRLHSMLGRGEALAGEGIDYGKPLPPVEGSGVRDTNHHSYNIPNPPRERKSYGQ
jgi:hypothetical protein